MRSILFKPLVIVLAAVMAVAAFVAWINDWDRQTVLSMLRRRTEVERNELSLSAPGCFVLDVRPDQVHVRSGWSCRSPRLPAGTSWLSFLRRQSTEVERSFDEWEPCGRLTGACEKYTDTIGGRPVECYRSVIKGTAEVITVGCRLPGQGVAFDYTCVGDLCDRFERVVARALGSYETS